VARHFRRCATRFRFWAVGSKKRLIVVGASPGKIGKKCRPKKGSPAVDYPKQVINQEHDRTVRWEAAHAGSQLFYGMIYEAGET
jgi:hypothetical protein